MSHLTRIRNVFARKDLLMKALAMFNVEVEENAFGYGYGSIRVHGDIVAHTRPYDLIFQKTVTTDTEAMRDSTETASDVGAPAEVYQPVGDFYRGGIAAMFGENLCNLNRRYYELLLQEQSPGYCAIEAKETKDEIVLTMEVA